MAFLWYHMVGGKLTFLFQNTLQWSINPRCLPWFSHTAIFWFCTSGFSTKRGDQQEKYCLPFYQFKCVIGKQYNLGKTSSLNYHSCQEIAEVCWEAIASIMYKGFCSVFDSFLLIYYQHKLKNTEMVSAFYCWYT